MGPETARGRRATADLIMAVAILVLAAILATVDATPALAFSTGNGGWQWQNPLPHAADYQSAFFLDTSRGWLVTDNCILSTRDGGATLTPRSNHNVRLRDITFIGARGWAVGRPNARRAHVIIYRSTDGGRIWVHVPIDVYGGLERVDFVSSSVGWAVGSTPAGNPLVLRTSDGGRAWTRQTLPAYSGCLYASMVSARRGWIATNDRHPIWRTTDGGETWKNIGPDRWSSLVALSFHTSRIGWPPTRTGCGGPPMGATHGPCSSTSAPCQRGSATSRSPTFSTAGWSATAGLSGRLRTAAPPGRSRPLEGGP